MDFFQRQDHSRRNTQWLVALFLLAVVGIIFFLQIILTMLQGLSPLDLPTLGWISAGVIVVVTGGSLFKISQLSAGGRVVAEQLGGVPLDPANPPAKYRQLLNVVEEMAIASGVPVPQVYVLPDASINAFAAGHGPGDAVIGVTDGCLNALSRDELQGVIGHEFSHLLNGDMRLNIQLMGILNGILCLAIIGEVFFRIAGSTRSSDSRSDRNGGSVVAFVVLAGLALFIIGWIGVFFGKLIKAAVSRQREFLADASAVQFTRNPLGIAGALYKIGQASSRISSPRAEEASHLFFGNGVRENWFQAFATHPPIPDRLAALIPNFEPGLLTETRPSEPEPPKSEETRARDWIRDIGRPGDLHVGLAAAMLASLPEFANQAVHDVNGAQVFVYLLLLSDEPATRAKQLDLFAREPEMRAQLEKLAAERESLNGNQRITLIDLAVGTLRWLTPEQYADFEARVKALVAADGHLDLFEFMLQKILRRHLALAFSKQVGAPVTYKSLVPVLPDVGVLLSGLVMAGHEDDAARDQAYATGVKALGTAAAAFPLKRHKECDLNQLDAALNRLAEASGEVKRQILSACGEAVMHDGKIEAQEAELLRAIADALDCPVPPLLPEGSAS